MADSFIAIQNLERVKKLFAALLRSYFFSRSYPQLVDNSLTNNLPPVGMKSPVIPQVGLPDSYPLIHRLY
jgi:hypothetical protein